MSTLVLGGAGFIGRRLVPLLVQRGEEVTCMDINPATASYGQADIAASAAASRPRQRTVSQALSSQNVSNRTTS